MDVATPAEISLQLSEAGRALKNLGIVLDDKPVQDAAQQVLASNTGFWHYQVAQLLIEVGGAGLKYFPTHIGGSGVTRCRLDMTVLGFETTADDDADPLKHNDIQIFLSRAIGTKTYSAAWHFDAQGKRGASHCLHPRYHMTFGGRQLNPQLTVDNGKHQIDNLMLLDSPRFAHPPMDLMLAVDFVLSHFAGPKWTAARKDVEYTKLLRLSQRRLWNPYFAATSKICGGGANAWALSPWPQLA